MALEQDIIVWHASGERIAKQLETAGQTLIRTLKYTHSLLEIAKKTKRSVVYLSRIENGLHGCSPATYLALCRVLD